MRIHKSIFIIFIISLVVLLAYEVQGVAYAEDHIYLYENGKRITDNSVIVSYDIYKEVCADGAFIRSQAHSINLTFYKTNKTDLMTYVNWAESINKNFTDYNLYLENEIANSLYNISISLPVPTDTEVHNIPPYPAEGGIIGTNRYCSVDIITGSTWANFYELTIIIPSGHVEMGSTFILTIANNTGESVPNVTVTFNNKTYQTDVNGNVTMTAPMVNKGTDYVITATKPGYMDAAPLTMHLQYTPPPIGFPGFELILAFIAVALVLFWKRKRMN